MQGAEPGSASLLAECRRVGGFAHRRNAVIDRARGPPVQGDLQRGIVQGNRRAFGEGVGFGFHCNTPYRWLYFPTFPASTSAMWTTRRGDFWRLRPPFIWVRQLASHVTMRSAPVESMFFTLSLSIAPLISGILIANRPPKPQH